MNNTFEWLLAGPPWIKYAVEKQLLDQKPDINTVLNDKNILEIIERLKHKHRGLSAIPHGYFDSDEYETPYWDLYFLADMGLSINELGLNTEIDVFLAQQMQNGTYLTEPGMKPAYFCKSAIMISSIARMGYLDNPHILKYIQLLLSLQRLDGGWYCNPNHDIGNIMQYEPSCPQDNLNILVLMGQYEVYRNDQRFNGAIDLLLDHWDVRATGKQIVYFGIGRRYQSLSYPATRYGILRVLDAISLFPYAFSRASFHNMLDFVHHKSCDGKYYAETHSPYTGLEPSDEPNRLITFIINRIDKRVSERV